MPTIDLVYFNAGGGHRSAALALQEVMREQRRPWTVRLVNFTEVIDPQGRFRRVTGMDPEDLYNKRLARGWTLGLAQELKLLQGMIRLAHGSLVRTLQQHWLCTLRHGAHRHGGPSAPLLDRAGPGTAPRLR
jgi:hypothetical protein